MKLVLILAALCALSVAEKGKFLELLKECKCVGEAIVKAADEKKYDDAGLQECGKNLLNKFNSIKEDGSIDIEMFKKLCAQHNRDCSFIDKCDMNDDTKEKNHARFAVCLHEEIIKHMQKKKSEKAEEKQNDGQ